MRRRLAYAVLLTVALCCASPGVVRAQDGGDSGAKGGQEADDSSEGGGASSSDGESEDSDELPDFPEAAPARLQRAKQAYGNAKYGLLEPLLEPTLIPESRFDDTEREIEARQLYGVGLFVEAQQTTNARERRDLLDQTRRQFLAILREEPDYELDPLNFPASVVELFEQVREEHSEELERIRAERSGEDGKPAAETFYVERVSIKRIFAVNFAPFGLGQFQNGNPLAGRIFAVSQGSMLALNAVAYLGIQLADSNGDGLYEAAGPGSELAVARTWRNVQWIALGGFSALYLWSVIDGIARYESEDVRIRSLDEPPPELSLTPREKRRPQVRLGIGSVLLRW